MVPSGFCSGMVTDGREERDRRNGANIEAANVGVAAHVEAVERRRNLAAVSRDPRTQHAEAEGVPALVHGQELLVLGHRLDVLDVAAQAGELGGEIEALPGVRTLRVVDLVVREVRNDLAGDEFRSARSDREMPRNSSALEVIRRRRAERLHARNRRIQ